MKLHQVSYHTENFNFDSLNLKNNNLIVGRNAIGKTRVINALHHIGQIILGKVDLQTHLSFTLEFNTKEGMALLYQLHWNESRLEEKLWLGKQQLIERTQSNAFIYNHLTQNKEEIFPPETKIILQSTRDLKKYPWIEKIQLFIQNSQGIRFGNITPQTGAVEAGIIHTHAKIAWMYQKLKPPMQEKVLMQMQKLQFAVNAISYNEWTDTLMIEDKNQDQKRVQIPLFKLSQGMHRSLSTLILLAYLTQENKIQLLIVDDLGEGLDYMRATQLGKILIDTCNSHHVQFICTSNDYFLMDVFDLENLTVLADYTEQGLKIVNQTHYPELYERFTTCGLSNFDFFSSDFIRRNLQ